MEQPPQSQPFEGARAFHGVMDDKGWIRLACMMPIHNGATLQVMVSASLLRGICGAPTVTVTPTPPVNEDDGLEALGVLARIYRRVMGTDIGGQSPTQAYEAMAPYLERGLRARARREAQQVDRAVGQSVEEKPTSRPSATQEEAATPGQVREQSLSAPGNVAESQPGPGNVPAPSARPLDHSPSEVPWGLDTKTAKFGKEYAPESNWYDIQSLEMIRRRLVMNIQSESLALQFDAVVAQAREAARLRSALTLAHDALSEVVATDNSTPAAIVVASVRGLLDEYARKPLATTSSVPRKTAYALLKIRLTRPQRKGSGGVERFLVPEPARVVVRSTTVGDIVEGGDVTYTEICSADGPDYETAKQRLRDLIERPHAPYAWVAEYDPGYIHN